MGVEQQVAERQVMALVERQLRPRDICTRAAFENAMVLITVLGETLSLTKQRGTKRASEKLTRR